eukprot:GEMP01002423.1.p1 GENE.GEMP01002423.1~~GEMP01002423.1.p1  ORF type:complete len:771 (+),score=188.96 GEMP01002423.1:189-2501(+)
MSDSVRLARRRTQLTRKAWRLQVANADAIIKAAQSLWSTLQQCGGEAVLRVALELACAPQKIKDLEAVTPSDAAERALTHEIMQTSLMLMDRLNIPRDEESEEDLAAGEKISELDVATLRCNLEKAKRQIALLTDTVTALEEKVYADERAAKVSRNSVNYLNQCVRSLKKDKKLSHLDFPLPRQDDYLRMLPAHQSPTRRDDGTRAHQPGSAGIEPEDTEDLCLHLSPKRKRVSSIACVDPPGGATNHERPVDIENHTVGGARVHNELQNRFASYSEGLRDPLVGAIYDDTRDPRWSTTSIDVTSSEHRCSNAPFHASTYSTGDPVRVSLPTGDFRSSPSPTYNSFSGANTVNDNGVNSTCLPEDAVDDSVMPPKLAPRRPQRHVTILEADSVTWQKEVRHLHTKLAQAHSQFAAMHREIKYLRRQERIASGGRLQSTGDDDAEDSTCAVLLGDIANSWGRLYAEFGMRAERLEKKRKEYAEQQQADVERSISHQEKKPKEYTEPQEAERAERKFPLRWSEPQMRLGREDHGLVVSAAQRSANAVAHSEDESRFPHKIQANSASFDADHNPVSLPAVRVSSQKQRVLPHVPTISLSPSGLRVSQSDASLFSLASPPLAPRQHVFATDAKHTMDTMLCKERNEPIAPKIIACDSPVWGTVKSDTLHSGKYLRRSMDGRIRGTVATPLGRYVSALDPLDAKAMSEVKADLRGTALPVDGDRIPEGLKAGRRLPVNNNLTRNEEATSSEITLSKRSLPSITHSRHELSSDVIA